MRASWGARNSVQFAANPFCKCRAVEERGKKDTMNSRSCHWLIVPVLLITASGAWAQQSAPPVPNQKKQAAELCSLPQAFDEKSIAALKQQAAHGIAAAQCSLGAMYALGRGVPMDYTRATFWLRKASEQGNREAQAMLLLSYSCEVGSPEVYSQAVAWFRKPAEQDDANAQRELGCWYARGNGNSQDYFQATHWFRKAAEQGDTDAQIELGMLYYDGHGVPQDYAQTALWFRKSAEQGNANAQRELGCWYKDGQGVPQDYAEAYFWLNLAAAGTPTDAEQVAKFRDEAASHLTPADLSREQERARKWFVAHQAKPQ
jgi:TPR repeat protein